jgi:hypothetical protein
MLLLAVRAPVGAAIRLALAAGSDRRAADGAGSTGMTVDRGEGPSALDGFLHQLPRGMHDRWS